MIKKMNSSSQAMTTVQGLTAVESVTAVDSITAGKKKARKSMKPPKVTKSATKADLINKMKQFIGFEQ